MPPQPPVPCLFFSPQKSRGQGAALLREIGRLPLDGGGALRSKTVPVARSKKAELYRRRLMGNGEFWSDLARVKERLRIKGRGTGSLLKTPDGATAPSKPQRTFDAFCTKWCLLGITLGRNQDSPLVQDLVVSATPTETLIRVPAFWSFDPYRDVFWPRVTEFHRAQRPVERQGEKLATNRAQRLDQIARLKEAVKMARALNLHGEARMVHLKRYAHLCGDTDDAHVRRLLRDGRELNGSVLTVR